MKKMIEKIDDFLDYINDIKNDIQHFEELKKMYQYTYFNYPELTEETADYLQGQMIHSHLVIRDSKTKLNKLYGKGEKIQMEKLEIMQWGKKRSVVYCVNTETGEAKIQLIDNDYLMQLDEMGLVNDEIRD